MRGRVDGRWSEAARGMLAGLALGLTALPGLAGAEDKPDRKPEVVSPPSSGSVTRITREEIERRQWRTLADVLRAQPGIHLSQLGGRGQDALVLFRGNPAGAVLLRMDGIDLSDPATRPIAAVNDPEGRSAGQIVPDLLTENIERIEIRRGPQSARYGSDAIGGVIDIVTRRGEGAPSPWAAFEIGGFGTTQQSVGIGGGNEVAGYSLSYTNARTRGISSGASNLGPHERDGDQNDTVSGRFDLGLGDALSIRTTGRWIDEDTQLDDLIQAPFGLGLGFGPEDIGPIVDRRPFAGERKRLYLGSEARLALLEERWVQTLGVRFSDHDVEQDDQEVQTIRLSQVIPGIAQFDIEQTRRELQRTERDGRRISLDWTNEVRVTPEHTLIFGLETERESAERVLLAFQEATQTQRVTPVGGSPFPGSMESLAIQQLVKQRESERLRNNAAFVGDVFTYERLSGELTLRLDDHDEYGSGLTYRAALGYLDPGSKLRVFASIATGFRDPDVVPAADAALVFFQSVRSTPPDPFFDFNASGSDLQPGDRTLERTVSRGIEVGFELPLLDDRLTLGATAFASRVRGLQTTELRFLLIDPDGNFVETLPFSDSAQARTRGVELRTSWRVNEWLSTHVDYTYTRSELAHVPVIPGFEDGSLIDQVRLVRPSGSDLTGVPKHRVNLAVETRPFEALSFTFVLRYVGERKDNLFTRSDTLGGYTVFDLAAGYAMNERIELFARVENLFDKDYNDLRLAEQPGIAGYLGMRARY
jgi:vitamin B12 transporter